MNPDPNDPNQFIDNPPDLQKARSVMSKEWLLVFGATLVMVVIVGLIAWHLTHG